VIKMNIPINNMINDHLSDTQQASLKRMGERFRAVSSALWSDKMGKIGILIIVLYIFIGIFAPYIAPYETHTVQYSGEESLTLTEPSLDHPFGTDLQGNDIFSHWVYGSRLTLLVAFVSGFGVMVIGSTVGLISGYYKGATDLALMRIVDILYGIPATPLVLVLVLFFGTSIWTIILALLLVLWRTMARIIRSQTLSLANRPYVKAAKAVGAGDLRIIYLHIAPNLLPLILVETTFVMAGAIILEASVSFLGFGPQHMVSWGGMLELAYTTGAMRDAWWWVIPPGLGITTLVLAFFYISRALEDIVTVEPGEES